MAPLRVFSGGPIQQKHGTSRSEVRFQVSCIPPLEFSLPVCSPSHHHPDDFVEFLKADCFRNNEAPPDGLLCSAELYFELKTLFHWRCPMLVTSSTTAWNFRQLAHGRIFGPDGTTCLKVITILHAPSQTTSIRLPIQKTNLHLQWTCSRNSTQSARKTARNCIFSPKALQGWKIAATGNVSVKAPIPWKRIA